MADLNFPKDRTELVPPGTGPLQTGDEYIAAGTTWIYNADAGAWGSGSGSVSPSDLYLSKVSDDTAAGSITFTGETTHNDGLSSTTGEFSGLTTHEDGISVTGGNIEVANLIRNTPPTKAQSSLTAVTAACNFAGQDVATGVTYAALKPNSVGNRENVVGFQVDSGLGADYTEGSRTARGFQGSLSAAGNGLTYNIHCSGSAPNFFAGDVLFHSTSHREPGTNNTNLGATMTSWNSGSTLFISRDNNLAFSVNRNGSGLIGQYRLAGNPRGEVVVSSGGCNWNSVTSFAARTEVPEFTDAASIISQLKAGRDGFAAEDIQASMPGDWVHQSEGQVMFDNTRLIPILTKALQEALGKIETLEQRLSDAGIA